MSQTHRKLLIQIFLFVLAVIAPVSHAVADTPKSVRNYIFGNSLIHHLTSSDETTVPYWLHHLATAAGNRYAVDGQWGFPEDFIKNLPPTDQWKFKGVPDVWDRYRAPFSGADYNVIMMNPANFIQYRAPDASPGFLGLGGGSQVDVAVTLFDWLEKNGSKSPTRYFIYEGWAAMGSFSKTFPPNADGMRDYHALNQGSYHDWYVTFVRLVNEKRPGLDVRLIPVASLLSKLLSEVPLKDLQPEDLYSDLSPHGTETKYFLAALIVYTMLYEEKPTAHFTPSAAVNSLVRDRYQEIASVVCASVLGAGKC